MDFSGIVFLFKMTIISLSQYYNISYFNYFTKQVFFEKQFRYISIDVFFFDEQFKFLFRNNKHTFFVHQNRQKFTRCCLIFFVSLFLNSTFQKDIERCLMTSISRSVNFCFQVVAGLMIEIFLEEKQREYNFLFLLNKKLPFYVNFFGIT